MQANPLKKQKLRIKEDTSCTDDKGFARRFLKAEDVVAGDAVLDGTGNVGVPRTSADGDQEILGGERTFALFKYRVHSVGVFKDTQTIDIFHFSGRK